jgi:predicted acylesterase/phospholipase RssA
MRRLLPLFALIAAGACAHYPVNPPLCPQPGGCKPDVGSGYRYANSDLPRRDDTFVILTFSGGGSRAAGFSYGVLRQLQKTTMPGGRTMLDYIDVISSVSGGSFTAMQYGLRGAAGLDSLKTDFLDKNIQGMLFSAAFLNPRNWLRLASPNFHRIDLAQELYDQVLFHDATFTQLLDAQKRERRPLIIANSTELEIGGRFEWTQDQFDPICSSLAGVRVSRAVAASSAFPGLLTPMVINSYPSTCNYALPGWVQNARRDEAVNPDRTRTAIELEGYVDAKRQFLHVMDGGIADNIGLRGPLHAVTSLDTFVAPDEAHPERAGFTIQGALNRREIKKLLFIVVTAEPDQHSVAIDARERVPNLVTVLGTVISMPMGNVSFDTINLLRQTIQNLDVAQRDPVACQQAARKTCPDVVIRGGNAVPVGYYQSVVSFPLVSDDDLRKRLNDIGTNFALKGGQLDDLVAGADNVLCASPGYIQFVQDLGGTVPACAAGRLTK